MKPSRLGLATLFAVLFVSTTPTRAQTPTLSGLDRVRLAEAFRLADNIGDRIWAGWSKAPFAVLLVTPSHEFLIRHPKPSADFTRIGYDPLLKSDVFYRARKYPAHWLATFPAVSGSIVSTIVIGQAENTSVKTSTPWVLTLLHEHFHQLQDSQPNFYADVNALNLSGGDKTGMWMLNYAFPYDRADVQQQFVVMSNLLDEAIRARGAQRRQRVKQYLAARRKFESIVSPADHTYFSFQLWKEGIARYTEDRIARLAARHHQPSAEFRALKDYRSYRDAAESIHSGIFKQLRTQRLGESKREVVYSYGAAEGLLLDQIRPGWRTRYFVEKFSLEKLFR